MEPAGKMLLVLDFLKKPHGSHLSLDRSGRSIRNDERNDERDQERSHEVDTRKKCRRRLYANWNHDPQPGHHAEVANNLPKQIAGTYLLACW